VKAEQGSAAVRGVLERAEAIAEERGAAEVGSLDLVLALARLGPGLVGPIFERYKVTADAVAQAAKEPAKPQNGAPRAPAGPLAPAPEVASAVARAGRAASSLGRETYEPEDLLLALLSDRGAAATELLRGRFELTKERLVEDLAKLRGQERMIAKAEGHDACGHAEGGAPPGEAPLGLAAELRDLEGRFRALCENVNELRARQTELVGVVRILWIMTILAVLVLVAAGGALRVYGPPR
jgi:ATP-dependent Clp protease ATP-binding subunit ClpA